MKRLNLSHRGLDTFKQHLIICFPQSMHEVKPVVFILSSPQLYTNYLFPLCIHGIRFIVIMFFVTSKHTHKRRNSNTWLCSVGNVIHELLFVKLQGVTQECLKKVPVFSNMSHLSLTLLILLPKHIPQECVSVQDNLEGGILSSGLLRITKSDTKNMMQNRGLVLLCSLRLTE